MIINNRKILNIPHTVFYLIQQKQYPNGIEAPLPQLHVKKSRQISL